MSRAERFRDRTEAGRRLARDLVGRAGQPDLTVLGLARGGVPVAAPVAAALAAPLDVFTVRKLGAPGQSELAMGAIATGGSIALNRDVIASLDVDRARLDRAIEIERAELERRERLYRGGREPLPIANRSVILVDDGLATGASMMAAISAVRSLGAGFVICAVPVAPAPTLARIEAEADQAICLLCPFAFHAVGAWYDDFPQVENEEVRRLLDATALG